jgi:hypothetical protein
MTNALFIKSTVRSSQKHQKDTFASKSFFTKVYNIYQNQKLL